MALKPQGGGGGNGGGNGGGDKRKQNRFGGGKRGGKAAVNNYSKKAFASNNQYVSASDAPPVVIVNSSGPRMEYMTMADGSVELVEIRDISELEQQNHGVQKKYHDQYYDDEDEDELGMEGVDLTQYGDTVRLVNSNNRNKGQAVRFK